MTLFEVLEAAAVTALAEQREDGSLPAGHNGPYFDPETPVRATCHWLVTFAKLYDGTGAIRWRDAVKSAGEYLLSSAARPHGFTFHHRDRPGKNQCNGVIGSAWAFEALAAAAAVLHDDRYVDLAEELFFLHPFDAARGLWQSVEIDGRPLSFDPTFNHQLWYAATASLLQGPRRSEVLSRVARFLDRCDQNLVILPGGLIYHPIPPMRLATSVRDRLRKRVTMIVKRTPIPGIRGRFRAQRAELLRKSIGYHAFNMHAFALVRPELPENPLWKAPHFMEAVTYLSTEEFARDLEKNPYAYAYNPPGFEVPFALTRLANLPAPQLLHDTTAWVGRQFQRTWDPATTKLARNNPDPTTLTARLYEAARLPTEMLNLVDVSNEAIAGAAV